MEFPSTFTLVLTIFFSLSFVLFSSNAIKKHRKNRKKLPPGPWKLPLIGNLHQLISKFPHRTLSDMAKKYGPLMYLQLGEVPVVVVSSPKIAKEILKTHDLVFSSRPETITTKVLIYDLEDVVFHPYDEYWKQMRKICVMELLSVKKVRSFEPIRREEGEYLVESIRNSIGKSVNLSKKIQLYTSTVVCRAAFGKECKDQESFLQYVKEASHVSAGFNLADLFPSSKLLLFLSGLMPRLEKISSKIDYFIEDVIKQHVEAGKNRGNAIAGEPPVEEALIDILLRIKETSSLNLPITVKNIKAIILKNDGEAAKRRKEDDTMMAIFNAQQEEEDGRSSQWGGSAPGRRYICLHREESHALLHEQYFADPCMYTPYMFRSRFRMHRPLCERIMRHVANHNNYFIQRDDDLGRPKFSTTQKVLCAIRQLAYGIVAYLFYDIWAIDESTSIEILKKFTRSIYEVYGEKYLRRPNAGDLHRLLAKPEERGFPGMIGSLDCMHWRWNACPKGWEGQFLGYK